MLRREALLVLAFVLGVGAIALLVSHDDAPPSPSTVAPPPPGAPAARNPHRAPAPAAPAASFRPRERLPLTAAGLVDVDPHVPTAQQGDAIRDYWAQVRAGDSSHAYELAYLLRECQLARTFLEGARDADTRELLQARVAQCRDVGPDLLEHRVALLELAASRGDIRAQTAFGLEPPADPQAVEGWRAKTLGYWQAAAERGSAGAMSSLTTVYRQGELGVGADPAAALAYYLSMVALVPKGADEALRRGFESRLTLAERERAFALHRDLMARCCEAVE